MDLVADAVTNKPTQLPTFHCIGVFLSKLAGHVEHSGKAQKDLQFITKLMFAERVRVGSLRISTKTWLSNVSTLTETVSNFCTIYAHLQHLRIHPSSVSQKTMAQSLLQVATSARVHLVMPGYLDMQRRLEALNSNCNKDQFSANDLDHEVSKFKVWVHNYALRTRHEGASGDEEGEPAKVTSLVRQWASGTLPDESERGFPFLQQALRRLKLVQEGEGDSKLGVLEHVTVDAEGVERRIRMEPQFAKSIEVRGVKPSTGNGMYHPVGVAQVATYKCATGPATIFVDAKTSIWKLSLAGLQGGDFDYQQVSATTYVSGGQWRHKSKAVFCEVKVDKDIKYDIQDLGFLVACV